MASDGCDGPGPGLAPLFPYSHSQIVSSVWVTEWREGSKWTAISITRRRRRLFTYTC